MSIEGGSQTLTYLIEAVDLATPTLRSFRAEVSLATKQAQDSMRGLQASTAETTAAVAKLSGAERTGADAASGYATAQTRSAQTTKTAGAETALLAGAHGRATSAVKGSTAAAAAHASVLTNMSGRLSTASSKTKEWGGALTGLTNPLLAVGAASLYASEHFGGLMEQLRTQAGYTQQSVNVLSSSVLRLSPQLAQTPDAIAQALYHIASVGIPAGKSLDVVKASADGANISGANLNDTANALATTMHNYPGFIGGATAAMGELNAIVGHGNLHMEDLVTNLGKVVPVAKAIGLTLPDVGSAIDVLTKGGMGAAQAATALRFTFASLEKPSSTAITALGQIGLSQSQLATDLHKPGGLLVALRDVKSHLDAAYPPGRPLTIQQEQTALDSYAASLKRAGVSAGTYKTDVTKMYDQLKGGAGANVLQTQDILSIFGGTRGVQGALPLLQNLPELGKVLTDIPKGKTAVDQLNASVRAWDKTQQGQLEHLKAGIEAAGVTFGKDIGPVVLPVLKDVTTGVEDITGAFSALPSATKHAIEIILGIGVVVGPLLKVLSPVLKISGALAGLGGKIGGKGTAGAIEQDVLGGHGGVLGGIVGVRGIPTMAGSLENPIAVQMLGGGMSPYNPTGTTTKAVAAEEATALEEGGSVAGAGFLATLRGGLGSVLGNLGPAAMIGIGGSLFSSFLGNAIGGNTGKTVSGIGTDASYGAGIGTLIGGPGLGTLAGAGIGGTVGALRDLFGTGGNIGDKMLQKITDDLKAVSAAPDPSKIKALHDEIVKFQHSGFVSAQQVAQLKQLAAATTPVTFAFQQMSSGAKLSQTQVTQDFATLASAIGSKMQTGQESVKQGTAQIDALLKMPTSQSNLSSAFRAMVHTITTQMDDGTLSVSTGVSKINHLLDGIKRSIQINVGVNVNPLGAVSTGNVFNTSAVGGSGSVAVPKGASPLLSRTVSFANQVNAQHYNYEWGGGHNSSFAPSHGTGHGSGVGTGFDCSGVISAMLHNDGLLSSPLTSGGFMSYGLPGEGGPNSITIYASPTHVFAKVGGRYFGTSSANPGGGAGWFSSADTSGFTARHVDLSPTAGSVLLPPGQGFLAPSSPTSGGGGGGGSNTGGGGGSSAGSGLTNPAGGSTSTTPSSYHYDWRNGTYHQFTATQYKALQNAWYHLHPHEPMPTSAAASKALSVGAGFAAGLSGVGIGTANNLFGTVAQINASLSSGLRSQGAALVQAAQTAPASMAGQIDHSAITQLQGLVQSARQLGLKGLTTGFLKDMESVTKSWDDAIDNTFQTSLSDISTREQLKITKQQLGITGINVKNGKLAFTGSQPVNASATSATDPAYLAAQEGVYATYITKKQGERADLEAQAAQAKKDHNKKLLASLKGDIAGVDSAISNAKLDVAGIAEAYNQAVYDAFLNSLNAVEDSFNSWSSNAGTLAGANETLADLFGSGGTVGYFQNLAQQQGGTLTPDQKTAAGNANQAFGAGQYGQEIPISGLFGPRLDQVLPGLAGSITPTDSAFNEGNYAGWSQVFGGAGGSELGADFSTLAYGHLNPTDQQALLSKVIDLIGTLVGFESSVQQNTDATKQLTGATVSNTAATVSTFGGQVTFSITGDQSGQSYIAGGTQSSVDTSHIGVGM